MSLLFLVDNELSSRSWGDIRCIYGGAENIPRAVKQLLFAETAKDAEDAYWKRITIIYKNNKILSIDTWKKEGVL